MVILISGVIYSCGSPSNQSNNQSTASEKKSSMPSLLNTKWQLEIADDCINYYLFKADSSSIYYSCETEDISYGKYFVKEDTLYIHEFVTDRDSLLSPVESEHRSEQAKYKLIIKDDKLKHVERWSYRASKDIWTKDDSPFGDNLLFERVK